MTLRAPGAPIGGKRLAFSKLGRPASAITQQDAEQEHRAARVIGWSSAKELDAAGHPRTRRARGSARRPPTPDNAGGARATTREARARRWPQAAARAPGERRRARRPTRSGVRKRTGGLVAAGVPGPRVRRGTSPHVASVRAHARREDEHAGFTGTSSEPARIRLVVPGDGGLTAWPAARARLGAVRRPRKGKNPDVDAAYARIRARRSVPHWQCAAHGL